MWNAYLSLLICVVWHLVIYKHPIRAVPTVIAAKQLNTGILKSTGDLEGCCTTFKTSLQVIGACETPWCKQHLCTSFESILKPHQKYDVQSLYAHGVVLLD